MIKFPYMTYYCRLGMWQIPPSLRALPSPLTTNPTPPTTPPPPTSPSPPIPSPPTIPPSWSFLMSWKMAN